MKKQQLLRLIVIHLLIVFFSGCAGGLSRREAARLYYNLGNAYLEIGKSDKASESYLKALEYDRKMKIASFNLAKAYMDAEKYSDAITILDSMLEEDPANVIILSAKAFCIFRFGNFEKAYELYEKVIEIDPANAEALYNSAVIKSEQGNNSEALEMLTKLRSRKIEDEKLLIRINYAFGEIYYKTDQFEEAIKYLDYVKEKEPENIKNLNMLFDSCVKTRYFSSAVRAGEQILEFDPDNKDLLFDMAVIFLVAIEDVESGMVYLEKAISSGFSDKGKARNLLDTPELAKKDVIHKLLQKGKLLDD